MRGDKEQTVAAVYSSLLSDRGRRGNNEDFVDAFEPNDPAELSVNGRLYVLADGVGGAAKGERASQYAAEKLLYEYYRNPEIEPGERLCDIIMRINGEIYAYAEESKRFTRMATTLVSAVIRNGHLIVANVGDSRAYLIRDGVATQITRDHSLVGEMVRNGEMSESEAQLSKIKNRLTRSLGGEPEVHVDVFPSIALKPGDKLLLCSDGLTRYAQRENIEELTAHGSPQEICQRLVGFANRSGGADNVSAVVVAYQPSEGFDKVVRIQKVLKPVSWDTMETQPDFRYEKKRRPAIRAKWGIWLTFAFGVLIVGGISAYGFYVHYIQPQQLTPTFSLQNAIENKLVTSPGDASAQLPGVVLKTTMQSTEVTGTPKVLIEPGKPTETTTPPASPVSLKMICVAQITEGYRYLSLLLKYFKTDFHGDNTYYRCSLDERERSCTDWVEIPPPYIVHVNDWVSVPGVEREDCDEKGGKWVER